ncbi:ATP-dependent RNA helicase SUV3 homolog, mitochondrial [Culicoides brevitarsis]|uniref:ATP-dependent RNA helicase SUV3 homolog, mitochondrial n=1 Tax=Culicoides brevitarsis TaxID=469753 RepID=UPI00307BDCCD
MIRRPQSLANLCKSLTNLRVSRQFQPFLVHTRGKKNKVDLSQLVTPVPIKPSPDDINVGAELSGKIDKTALLKILNQFTHQKEIRNLCLENALDESFQQTAFMSFRKYCMEMESLPVDLHITISDILQGAGHPTDLFPYFLRHAKQIFPHLDCMDDLKKISDLREPANWYPSARAINRKIIFHSGPTNSGKTYHAMQRFAKAKSGVYCGPLKLLAQEVYHKINASGTDCDLVTGEERKFAQGEGNPSPHVSCTVEMTSVNTPYEVAVIDEIQQIKDPGRGWAWTRAFLGLIADEIHVCGEPGTAQLLQRLCDITGETLEIRHYKRLTSLTIEKTALGSLNNVQPGDCIVCFSKNDIYSVSRQIEASGKEVAVIYGSLPPNTKIAQSAKFNDVNNSCKVMVATDAIGMGLNLSIRRVIFYSLIKPMVNEKGEKEMDTISVSQALQIAGRAGRYGTQWEHGYVTTYKHEDLPTLNKLLASPTEPITQAGLHPTADQIELYAFHLPNSSLSNLIDIFITLSTVDDSLYFMCNIDDFKFLAEMIQHVPLPLRARYVFCCAPINRKMPLVCSMFLKYARQYSKNEPVTFDWLSTHVAWPWSMPKTIVDLVNLEAVFDTLDLYLWLSYRFMDIFPDAKLVRDMQKELDQIIQQGVFQITKLLKNSETPISSNTPDEDSFALSTRKNQYNRNTVNVTKSLFEDGFFSDDEKMQRRGKEMSKSPLKYGKLSKKLIEQGLLTPEMLEMLKKEWSANENNSNNDDDGPFHVGGSGRRGRKK